MKKQTILSVSITFITRFTFLMLTLFMFEGFGWNVIFKDALTIVKAGLIYGLLSIIALFILNFYLAYKLKSAMVNLEQLDIKKMVRFLFMKMGLDFILSSVMIYLSLLALNNQIKVVGIFANLGVMILTFIFKGIFQMVISYRQNKDKIGGVN